MNNHSIGNMKSCDHLRQAVEVVNIARFHAFELETILFKPGASYV